MTARAAFAPTTCSSSSRVARRTPALLTTFGSLAGVRRATREELEHVVGANAARAVIDYFAQTSR